MIQLEDNRILIGLNDCNILVDTISESNMLELRDINFFYKSENMSDIFRLVTATTGDFKFKKLVVSGDKIFLDDSYVKNVVTETHKIKLIELNSNSILINYKTDLIQVFLLDRLNENKVLDSIEVRR